MTTPSIPATMKAVRISEYGGAGVLTYEDVPTPAPTASQVLVRIQYAGVNYIDTYHRTGLYPSPLPLTIGREGSGRVVQAGADVKEAEAAVGDAVVFFAQGSYAEYVAVEASAVYRLPPEVSTRDAAAVYLQGLTAHYLTSTTFPVQRGEHVLVHAAAGGTGALIVQCAKLRGAVVIGTAGSEVKCGIAKDAGCDYIINYTTADFVSEVKRITQGAGVAAVYDGVGAATWERSIKSLRRRGYLVLFGSASGAVPPINPLDLTKAGSIFLTRPTLADYLATRAEMLQRADELFGWMAAGKVKLNIARALPLSDAREAHELLESRKLSGKILLEIAAD